jgi:hypothetical protein
MFEVRWIQTAQDELATIWMQADSPSRQDITAAAHTIDQELQTDPQQRRISKQWGADLFCSAFGPSLRS